MTTKDELRRIALDHFAVYGFHGASLMQIAEAAGTSKASVLYHFSSKELLLEAALQPALDAIAEIVDGITEPPRDPAARRVVFERFVDILKEHRQAATVFITQRGALADVGVIERGNELIVNMTNAMVEASNGRSPEAIGRMSIGLAGTAFILGGTFDTSPEPFDETTQRELLVDTLMRLSEDV